MRLTFNTTGASLSELKSGFADVGKSFRMAWQLHDCKSKPRMMIMVSKAGHCLNDLLYATGALNVEIPVITSNHRDFQQLSATYDILFHHLPVAAETKAAQEAKLLDLIEQERIDLVVLARYMQILSDCVYRKMPGKIINIHHSFLPSFKGARPYHQALSRGVKLIGATAHYVTPDLDEGPIIEHEVLRVDHALTPEDLSAIDRDVEAIVLARAVKFHFRKPHIAKRKSHGCISMNDRQLGTGTRGDLTIIDGTATAAKMYAELRSATLDLAGRGITPGLAVVLVGDNPASSVYVRNKVRCASGVGFRSFHHALPTRIDESDLLLLIDRLNSAPDG